MDSPPPAAAGNDRSRRGRAVPSSDIRTCPDLLSHRRMLPNRSVSPVFVRPQRPCLRPARPPCERRAQVRDQPRPDRRSATLPTPSRSAVPGGTKRQAMARRGEITRPFCHRAGCISASGDSRAGQERSQPASDDARRITRVDNSSGRAKNAWFSTARNSIFRRRWCRVSARPRCDMTHILPVLPGL